MRAFATGVWLVVCAALAGPLQAAERISERVFFVRDKPGTPLKFRMVVNAGCLDEAGAQCRGLAHYLEHLVLVGRNPEHKEAAIRMFGSGEANGYTNMRSTVYTHTVPARPEGSRADLDHLLGFYAARLKDFSIPEDEAARERNIVLQEHDWRVQTNPYLLAWRDLWRKALPDHPFGQWTIGTREDIQAFTLEQARAFHRAWYAPNNVWFVISGDMEPAQVKEAAAKALAGLEARKLPPRNFAAKPDVKEERLDSALGGGRFRQPGVQMLKLLRTAEADPARNRAVRAILGRFFDSELPGSPRDVLAADRKVAGPNARLSISRAAPDTFLLSIGLNAASGVTTATLRDEAVSYLARFGTGEALTDAIVERLKMRILRDLDDIAKNPAREFAQLVSWLDNRNSYEDLLTWKATVAGVTGQDVRDFAKALAGPGRLLTQTIDSSGAAP